MLNVKKTSLLSIAFILLFSLYFSCNATQKKSAQADILKIAYYVRYMHSDKQVKAEISFSEIVDSTKKIIPKKMEEVLFQNNVLDGKKSQTDISTKVQCKSLLLTTLIFPTEIMHSK